MARLSQVDLFFCACCERELPKSRLSTARLLTPAQVQRLLCIQCEGFLSSGLPFLVEKIEAKKLKMVQSHVAEYMVAPTAKVSKVEVEKQRITLPRPVAKRGKRPRHASALERESFNYRAMTVELYIEGFIKGLEAAGVDRNQLSSEAVAAINNLLHISQTLAGQRMQVSTDQHNRSDIRRMARHVDETALMVEEYIQAVAEECAKFPST